MTTAINTRTGTAVLYLAIDIGERPNYRVFANQVLAVNTLQNFCLYAEYLRVAKVQPSDVNSVAATTEYLRFMRQNQGLAIMRTAMASPWVSVLTDLAANSKPIAYGTGALFGLHKIMDMVMTGRTIAPTWRTVDGQVRMQGPALVTKTNLARKRRFSKRQFRPTLL